MKKETVLSVRVEPDIEDVLRKLAEKSDRTVAWVIRTLIIEALERRKLLKNAKSKQ
jgi:predicted transcriptional regulator